MEINRLNHELDVLRARYATYDRCARMLRIAFIVCLTLMVILISAAIIKVFVADMLMGIFFAGGVVVCLFVWLLCGFDPRDIRWIDVTSVQISPFSLYPSIPFTSFRRGSDARIIEEQIAQRERRLQEIGQSLA